MTISGESTIVVVTNGNYFAARALGPLLDAPPPGSRLHVVVSASLRRAGGPGPFGRAWRLARRWGARYTAFKVVVNVVVPALEVVTRRPFTVAGRARRAGVSVDRAPDLNSDEGRALLRRLAPDVLVSVSCPYLLSAETLSIPVIGNLNVHSSLLPAYAGVSTYVHVLANGERETGVTVHEMVPAADAGRVLRQEPITIRGGESAFALFGRQCDISSRLLLETVHECIRERGLTGVPQDPRKRTYFRDPSAVEVAKLRQNGHALMRWRDALDLVRGAVR